jgi:hypothetical protein
MPITSGQVFAKPAFVVAFAVALGRVLAKTPRGYARVGMSMVRALELAVEALKTLPTADQERMGRQLLTYVEKLMMLRVEIEKGARVLEAEAGVPLDIDEFLQRQNARHGRA